MWEEVKAIMAGGGGGGGGLQSRECFHHHDRTHARTQTEAHTSHSLLDVLLTSWKEEVGSLRIKIAGQLQRVI